MADFEAVTSSNGIVLDADQRTAVNALLDKYTFSMEDVYFGDGDVFGIWGNGWLNILLYKYHYQGDEPLVLSNGTTINNFDVLENIPEGVDAKLFEKEPDNDGNEVSDEFFDEFRKILKPGQKLIVQSIGHENCRFPLNAMQVIVTLERTEWFSF